MTPGHNPSHPEGTLSVRYRSAKRVLEHPATAWVVLLLSLVLTGLAWYISDKAARTNAEQRFGFQTEELSSAIRQRMQEYETVLRGGAGLFKVSERVGREAWRQYVANLRLEQNFPGIQGLGFALMMPATEVERHISSVRAEGFPDYTLHPAGKRDPSSAIVYLEPFNWRNQRAFGFDMFAEPTRRIAMTYAMESGEIAVSGGVTLRQETAADTQRGFLMYVPVYRRGMPTRTVEERRAAIRGFVYAPFRTGLLMQGIRGADHNGIHFELFDGQSLSAENLLFDGAPTPTLHAIDTPRTGDFSAKVALQVGNRDWTLSVHAPKGYLSAEERILPLIVAGGGVSVNILLFLIIGSAGRQKRRAETEAAALTSSLLESEARYQSMFNSAKASMLLIDPEAGTILEANPAALEFYGYSGSAIKQLKISDLSNSLRDQAPPDAAFVPDQLRDHFFAAHRRANGEIRQVEVYSGPFRFGGRDILYSIVHDVTERKQAEAALRIADQRFLDIVNTTDGIVWEADASTFVFTFISQQAERLLGFTVDEWRQPGFWVLHLHPEDREWAPAHCVTCTNRMEPHDFEYRFIAKDGRTVWLRDIVTVVAEDGSPRWLRGIMVDISTNKQIEMALRESEHRWKFAIEGAGDGLWDWDLRNGKALFSKRWKELIGYAENEIDDHIDEWKIRLHPDDKEQAYLALKAHFAGETTIYQTEFRLRCKEGGWKWFLSRGMVVSRGADDEPLRMIGTHTDITDRKAAEIELNAAYRFQQSILDAAPYAIVAIRTDGIISHFGKGAERMLGYSENEVIGMMSVADLHEPAEISACAANSTLPALLDPAIEPLIESARNQDTSKKEWTLVRKDGSRFPALISVTALHDEEGAINGFLGIAMDISEQIETNARINQAMIEAQSATRAKSEFLAQMSHEIRTPMNAIVGTARLLADGQLTPQQLVYTQIMRRSSHMLMSLIDQILDFSKIEADRVELKKDKFSPAQIIDGLAGLASVSTEGKAIEIIFDIAPDLPERLIGDSSRLQQVLNNLMSNAIKFTNDGEITLTVRREPANRGDVRLLFAVSDTGIGIPANKLDAIFDPFVQAENATTRAYHGTGLGLTISRRLVDMMSGTLTVESALGSGSRFTFSALFQLPPGEEETYSPPPWMAGRRIGLVEPNAVTRQILDKLLRGLGADVVASASCGEDCLCHAELPIEVTVINQASALRARENGTLKRVGQTILTVQSNAEKELLPGTELGADTNVEYLVKPITRDALVNSLGIAFGAISSDRPPPNVAVLPLAGRRILMVEDNQFNRVVMNGMLHRLEVEVDTAIDGHDAIACFDSGGPYDAILMDLHMPGLNGFDCARAIRALPGGADVPIIAVTADILPETTRQCHAAGINDHLIKPVEPETLLHALMSRILGDQSMTVAEAKTPDIETDDRLPDQLPGVELTKARKWCSGSAQALAQLLDRMFSLCGEDPEKLSRFIAEGDIEAAARITHDLVGVAATVGATVLADYAKQVNREIREGRADARQTREFVANISAEFDRLDEARRILRQRVG